jgi:hypothetical protein
VGSNNPLGGRAAWAGTNASYPAFDKLSIDLGKAFIGKDIQVRLRIATDEAVADEGIEVDSIEFHGVSTEAFHATLHETADAACVVLPPVADADDGGGCSTSSTTPPGWTCLALLTLCWRRRRSRPRITARELAA